MNFPRNKIYAVMSLSHLKAIVTELEQEANELYGIDHPDRENCCVVLRGYLASGKNSRSKLDNARQVSCLGNRTQLPELFNFS